MDFEKIAFEVGMLLVGALSTWGAMKSQVSDLRASDRAQNERHEESLRKIATLEGLIPKIVSIDRLALQVNTLEAQHDSQAQQLKDALRKLEQVTETLQGIALELARTKQI